jgi:hypothetical protein
MPLRARRTDQAPDTLLQRVEPTCELAVARGYRACVRDSGVVAWKNDLPGARPFLFEQQACAPRVCYKMPTILAGAHHHLVLSPLSPPLLYLVSSHSSHLAMRFAILAIMAAWLFQAVFSLPISLCVTNSLRTMRQAGLHANLD